MCTITPQTAGCLLHAIGMKEHEQEVIEQPPEMAPIWIFSWSE
jgi:hypothetical protein